MRRHINYSDEHADDQVLNLAGFDDDNNGVSNDYTPVEVPRRREGVSRPQQRDQADQVDIDQLIFSAKPKEEAEAFFEEEDN